MRCRVVKRFFQGFTSTVGRVLDAVFIVAALILLLNPEIAEALNSQATPLDRRTAALPLLVLAFIMLVKALWDEAAEANRELDEFHARRPLEFDGDTNQSNYLRLRLRNPNRFDVSDAFVKIENYFCVDQFDNLRDLPPNGFKFGWCTYEQSEGRIAANQCIIVDIVAHLSEEPLLFHIGPGSSPSQNNGNFPIEHGNYRMQVAVGSGASCIPTARYFIDLAFDEDRYDLTYQALSC